MPIAGGAYQYQPKMQDAATGTGNGTAMTCTAPGNGGWAVLVIQLVISNTATVTFEATVDGSNWIAILFENLNSGASATTATASGLYRATVLGLTQVRARVSSYSSGTITALGQMVS
jgi:hypothetical protein